MDLMEIGPLAWLLVGTQLIGLASAWTARVSEGSPLQACCQWVFLGSLALVGLATMLSLQLRIGSWLVSGTTLALMVLAATCEFTSAQGEAAASHR